MSAPSANSPTPNSRAEKVSLAVALTILALVVGAILILWASPADAPARFTAEHGPPRQEQDAFYLPITITNHGDATASQVQVEGTLFLADEEEQVSTTFDFLPGHAQADAVFIFSTEPTTISLRVTSFQSP